MNILRIIYALVISGIVTYWFLKSWGIEHRTEHETDNDAEFKTDGAEEGDKKKYISTIVWQSPIALIGVIVYCPFALAWITHSLKLGFIYTFYLMFAIMIMYTVFSMIVLFLLPLLRAKISARACAILWLAPTFIFAYIFTLSDNQNIPSFMLYIPHKVLMSLFFIWMGGFFILLTVRIISGLIFSRDVKNSSYPEQDEHTLAVFHDMQHRLGYYNPKTQLLCCPNSGSPFAIGGFFHKEHIILPGKNYTDQELSMIFSHELHHLQRGDVQMKELLVFLTSLCWFHPLVWIAARKAAEDLELSCDEIVCENMDAVARKQYALLLLSNAGSSRGFTTCLSSAAGVLRYRMKQILTSNSRTFHRKHILGTVCLTLTVFVCFMAYGKIQITDQQGSFTDLLAGPDSAISYISVTTGVRDNANTSFDDINLSQLPELTEALDSIKLQKINSYGQYYSSDFVSDASIYLGLKTSDGFHTICINPDLVTVYSGNTCSEECYYKVISDIDMDDFKRMVQGF